MKLSLAIILLLATVSVPACATSIIKPGLWEIQTKTTVDGRPMPDIGEMMKNLPPEAQKQMEARLARQGVGAGFNALGMQACVTPEMADRNNAPVAHADCTTEYSGRSGNKQSFRINCPRTGVVGEGETIFESSESYTTHMKTSVRRGTHLQATTMETHAKWLGPNCGQMQSAK